LSYSAAIDKKALDIVIYDLRKISSIADIFMICSGTSSRQVQAIADAIMEEMDNRGIRCHHVEGYEAGRWVLLDYNDVIVHIFYEETRRFYSLERLWGDAPTIVFDSSDKKVHDAVKR
jgi:ribosome-associated protein